MQNNSWGREVYFLRVAASSNIKFRPNESHPDYVKKLDSNHSDIDVLGVHPLRTGNERVIAVSCKSWQGGFNPAAELNAIAGEKIVAGRERWKSFRELVSPKWSEAFLETIEGTTGTRRFTYVTAVTRVNGDKLLWDTAVRLNESLKRWEPEMGGLSGEIMLVSI